MTCRSWTAYRGASVNVDAETQSLRHSEATQWPWNPPRRGTRPNRGRRRVALSTVILAKIPPPRTRTQRSGSRTKRRSKGAGEAFAARRKRSRADFATTQSPRQGLGSTLSFPRWNQPGDSRAERENDSRKPWTRRLTISVIQRPQAVESHGQGQRPNRGRGRVALSSVIPAQIPPPRTRTQRSGSRPKRRSKGVREAFAARRKRNRADFATTKGQGGSVTAQKKSQKKHTGKVIICS